MRLFSHFFSCLRTVPVGIFVFANKKLNETEEQFNPRCFGVWSPMCDNKDESNDTSSPQLAHGTVLAMFKG